MSLYFEQAVNFPESNAISTCGVWHSSAPLLAIASYSQEKGGFVTIFDDLGDARRDVNYPIHAVSQVTALVWHPERTILATGWENGELKIWNGIDKDFANVNGPQKAPIMLLEFSEKGGRLVSCDSTGSLVGWKVDSKGQAVTVFHHDLKESITHLTFRLSIKINPSFDVNGLARAAVNGDEQALDIFSNWRPKTTARKFRISEGFDNQCFFVGTQNGSIYYVNQGGSCSEVLNTEGIPLSYILYHPTKDALIVMMEGLTVGHFTVDSQGHLVETAKVKLSGRVQSTRGIGNQGVIWAGDNSLAILTGDLTVRMWNIETNDNYVLPTVLKQYANEDKNSTVSEIFTCLSYSTMNQTLCAGTNIGRIYFWIYKYKSESENPEDSWELNNVNTISGTVKQVMWGSVHLHLPLLSVNCVTKVYIMKEQNLCTCFCDKVWAAQKTANQVLLQTPTGSNQLLQLEIQVTDMSVNENYIVFTNGRLIYVYEVNLKGDDKQANIAANFINMFSCDNEGILVCGRNVAAMTVKGVVIRSTNGMTVATIATVSAEGEPIGMNVTGNFLTVFTIEGYLKVYDVSEREPKLVTAIRNLYDVCNDFGEIIQAKCNSVGSKVALTLAAANLIPDGKLYVLDLEQDKLMSYNFRKYNRNDYALYDGYESTEDDDNNEDSYDSYAYICANRIPLSLHWDSADSRLLVCNAKKLKRPSSNGEGQFITTSAKHSLKDEDQIIVTMFTSSEHGICIQDIRATDPEARLLAVATPYIVTLKKLVIVREVMSDFIGLENCNKTTRDAVLDFSYNLSLGNMDAAFKAIKLVQSVGVWSSLARMCVKTKRIDVASVCLGHMGNARAARALRQVMADVSLPLEAKLAVLAVQLGMLDEAEQLYVQCEHYDLLNKLLQCRYKMESAHSIAESKDRIHFRNTEHVWAKTLELEGNFKEAISRYEKANTHRYDVPRMLLDQPQELEAYMSKTNDPELLKWWGQYMESQGDLNSALRIYTNAGDIYSQVRVLCFLQEENKAAQLTRSSTDKAAYYHMARHYEAIGKTEEAVAFFTRANAYSNAVRLCKENNMYEELWNIGNVAGNREKLECAKCFEESDHAEKAVILYHRAGLLHKALDLAFKAHQFETLQQIATDLDSESDPALIVKCAEYFVTNQQFDKAVDLLAIGKRYKEAISICLTHNVQLTEDLAEKLTPEKDLIDDESRIVILENLAESLTEQGNYHLATKKFTQAGNKVRAMKALLKSGDTDKIIFFAGVSRQREIYIMAANYLQSLDWLNQPEILRNIIAFYSKGKAMDLLANFYVACAQIEIDEFQNYEKAHGALIEASRCLNKVTTPTDLTQHKRAAEIIQQRLAAVKRFVDIRKLFERGDIHNGMNQCRQFLTAGGEDLESSVRRGDIYGLMIHNCVKTGNFLDAKQLFGELKHILSTSGNLPVTFYLNKDLLEALAKGIGIPITALVPTVSKNTEDYTEDEVEEEVVEE